MSESDDAREWLAALADRTMPRDDEATGPITLARSVEPSAQSMLFDGVLGMLRPRDVPCRCHQDGRHGEQQGVIATRLPGLALVAGS